jgi:hypothetical protein
MALLSSLEVIVLALAALPSSVWELEIILLFVEEGLSFHDSLLGMEGIVGWIEGGLMKWLHTSSRSSYLGKLVNLSDGWLLSGSLYLLKWWEIKLLCSLWEIFTSCLSWLLEALV